MIDAGWWYDPKNDEIILVKYCSVSSSDDNFQFNIDIERFWLVEKLDNKFMVPENAEFKNYMIYLGAI